MNSRLFRKKLLYFLRWIPDKYMLGIQYRIKMGRWPSLKHPVRFTEKIQLYKMRYRNPLLPICVDKYDVRSYIKSKGLEYILNENYGVYDSPDEISFGVLPKSFVIKTTTGGGGLNVIIVKDKMDCDWMDIIKTITKWYKGAKRRSNSGREWAYNGIPKPRIVIEKLLENPENPNAGIDDFKFMCFNGKPEYIIVDVDRFIDHRRNIYTTNWEKVEVTTDHGQINHVVPKPENLDTMLSIAQTLSSDFPFVRVDMYNIAGNVVFGELTFYPWSGYVSFCPDEFDFTLGSLMSDSLFS